MSDILQSFRKLGLSTYEAKAFARLLQGPLPLKELSRQSGLPFGRVYSVVKSLREQGIVQETDGRPKQVFVQNPSKTVLRLMEKRRQDDEFEMERITTMVSELELGQGQNPGFYQIGTTNEENREIQNRAFNEARKEVLQFFNVYHKPGMNRENKSVWEQAIEDSIKRGVRYRAIYPRIELPPKLQAIIKGHPDSFKVRYLKSDYIRFDIIDDDKVLLKLVSGDPLIFGGVLFIVNKRLNRSLRKVFESMWRVAKARA